MPVFSKIYIVKENKALRHINTANHQKGGIYFKILNIK